MRVASGDDPTLRLTKRTLLPVLGKRSLRERCPVASSMTFIDDSLLYNSASVSLIYPCPFRKFRTRKKREARRIINGLLQPFVRIFCADNFLSESYLKSIGNHF